MTAGTLIIGYGNPLRGDDRIGQAVAEALAGEAASHSARVIVCHQLTPDLAPDIAAARLVVFVDAAVNIRPGVVAVREVRGASAPSTGLVHTASPAALLELALRLYGGAPDAYIVTVGVGSLALSEALSPAVAAAVPEAVAAVTRLIMQRRDLAGGSAAC